MIVTMIRTMIDVVTASFRLGQITFEVSWRTWRTNSPGLGFAIAFFDPFSGSLGHFTRQNRPLLPSSQCSPGGQPWYSIWQERRDSNPQPPVLETGALPVELHSHNLLVIGGLMVSGQKSKRFFRSFARFLHSLWHGCRPPGPGLRPILGRPRIRPFAGPYPAAVFLPVRGPFLAPRHGLPIGHQKGQKSVLREAMIVRQPTSARLAKPSPAAARGAVRPRLLHPCRAAYSHIRPLHV